MAKMRAKMRVTLVTPSESGKSDQLHFCGVSKDGAYPSDGTDEDNSFALWSPSVDLSMTVNNPALVGSLKVGDTFYVDFIPVGE